MKRMRSFELWIPAVGKNDDLVVLRAFEAGVGGLEERRRRKARFWVAYAGSKREAQTIAQRLHRQGIQVAIEESEKNATSDWQTKWMRFLEPVSITDSIVLSPVGKSPRTGRRNRLLWFEPDQVFGVGSHPTTQLAARAVERVCRDRPNCVLDVGTGTGVLAMVAVLSGALSALGIDVDRRAVASARKNAALNDLGRSVRFSTAALARIARVFDVVVANIEATALEPLIADLARVTKPNGALLVTGLLEERRNSLETGFRAAGMRRTRVERRGEWALVELRHRPAGQGAAKLLGTTARDERKRRAEGPRRYRRTV